MMDVKKRKREMLSDQLSEDEDEDGDCKVIPIFDKLCSTTFSSTG